MKINQLSWEQLLIKFAGSAAILLYCMVRRVRLGKQATSPSGMIVIEGKYDRSTSVKVVARAQRRFAGSAVNGEWFTLILVRKKKK